MEVYAEIYYSPLEIEAWFQNQPKCRYKVSVEKLEENNIHDCFSTLHIKAKDFTLEQSLFSQDCDGGGGLSRGHPKKDLEVGNTIYGIANSETFKVIYGGKKYFEGYPEIPVCKGGNTPQFSQNIIFIGIGIFGLIILCILLFLIKKSLKKSKHKK